MSAHKGVKIKGITIKAVPKGSLPPPPEAARTDLTTIVPTMLKGKIKINVGQRTTPVQQSRKTEAPIPKPVEAPKPVELPTDLPTDVPRDVPQTDVPTLPEPKPKAKPVYVLESDDENNNLSDYELPSNLDESPVLKVPAGHDDVPPNLIALQAAIVNKEKTDNYTLEDSQVYIPQTSRRFSKFITTTFSDFALPPRPATLNYDACSTLEMRIYEYQKFVREYMRQASPYRGILVYHGLGSGKTCTSIATAEALYGVSNKKIIVMTPISLQENFLNELSVCGFQHFKIQNFWVPFDLTDPAQRLFAQEVAGIPASYIRSVLRKDPTQRVFWMPDFTKESNFESLEEQQKTAIRSQIRAIIMNRITFIGYTGITHDKLKQIACDTPNFFDDSVIIVDEIHNLTRLMRGKLEKYLKNVRSEGVGAPQPGKKPKKIPFSYEPVTTKHWIPKLCGSSQKYDRAFLIYRLLAEARNSKIIALSGTPIVNFPEEIGILCNMLHGYFHTAEDRIKTLDSNDIKNLDTILKMHPRIQYYTIRKSEGFSVVYFSKLEDGYIKSFQGDTMQGIVYAGTNAVPDSIEDIYADVVKLASSKIKFNNAPIFSASSLFPETSEEFTNYFVDTNTLRIKNPLLFKKRVTGLISYYKGAKEELMPKVVKDEIVLCPMTVFALGPYAEARKKEREEKSGSTAQSSWDEIKQLSNESESASYRFRSRAACNFVFPKGIPRPFPSNKKEYKDSAKITDVVLGDTEADAVEDDLASQGVAEAIGQVEADEEDDEQPLASAAEDMRIPYKDRIKIALEALRSVAKRRFSLDGSKPEEEQLANYSGKFVEIMKRIDTSPGSSLIYSQFRTLEGIGIFSIVLDTNGYAPLTLTGPENDLQFSPETEESLLNNPQQPRYIIYSGEESKTIRQTLINVFNTKISSLPPKISQVLLDSGLIDPVSRKGNYKGEICKVFMITGAGAEGLSLRNVRTVHIMEPYWNSVRTDQVKGRAVRICSHSDLHYDSVIEQNERTVEIFTYVSMIPDVLKSAKAIDQTLLTEDDGKTTDQHILNISVDKEKLGKDFLNAMKESAVDCTLNQTENEAISCFVYDGPPEQFIYDPRIREDKDKTDRELKEMPRATLTAQPSIIAQNAPTIDEYAVIKYKGVQYIVKPEADRNALYLEKDRTFSKEVGRLFITPEGKKMVKLYG